MKKAAFRFLSYLMLLAFVPALTSCDPEPDQVTLPQVSVVKSHYNLATGSIEVSVKSDVAPAADLKIPVRIATGEGMGKEGTDFTLSAQEFVIKAGEQMGSITVTRVPASIGDNDAKAVINLESGNGYTLGLTNYCEVALLSKNSNIVNFIDKAVNLYDGDTASFEIELRKQTGTSYSTPAETTFQLEVDTDLSTAVEGKNFQFTDGKNVVVAAKKSKGSFSVKCLNVEEGKDKLVLRVADQAGFAPGANATITISLKAFDNFTGKWEGLGVQNLTDFALWGEDTSTAPVVDKNDVLVFEGSHEKGYTFTPTLKSNLKNYFGSDSRTVKYSKLVERMYVYGISMKMEKIFEMLVPGVNVKFSASATDKKEAKVYFRIIEFDGKETLECSIEDWYPVKGEFGASIAEWSSDGSGSMVDQPLRIYFTRVK